jgi:hypothetical protein
MLDVPVLADGIAVEAGSLLPCRRPPLPIWGMPEKL